MNDGLNLISFHELEDRRRCRNCMIIDLRSPELFAASHVPEAVNLPFEDFDQWKRVLPRNRTLILYCERGGSAMQAGRKLMQAGYRVEIVSGGYNSIQQRTGAGKLRRSDRADQFNIQADEKKRR